MARDRAISTVDPEARHGHKSRARTFDGCKAHLAIDPDDELITNVTVTPAKFGPTVTSSMTCSPNPARPAAMTPATRVRPGQRIR